MLEQMTNLPTEYFEKLYHKALAQTNMPFQALHLSEEMSECVIEVSKLIRGRKHDTADLAEEIADVMIMLDEMRSLFFISSETINKLLVQKLNKFEARINANEKIASRSTSFPKKLMYMITTYWCFSNTQDTPALESHADDIRDEIYKTFMDIESAEQAVEIIQACFACKLTFDMCFNLLTAVFMSCVNNGNTTLAHFKMVPSYELSKQLRAVIDKLVDVARASAQTEGKMTQEQTEKYLARFVLPKEGI